MNVVIWSYYGALALVLLGAWRPGIYLAPITFVWDLWLEYAFCKMMRHSGDPRYHRKARHHR